MRILFIALMIVLSGCTKNNTTPEGALKNYIDLRFSNNINLKNLSDYFVGPLYEKLAVYTEEEIKNFFTSEGLIQNKFEIISKSCQADKCYLTYSLSYNTEITKEETYKSKVKKVVELWKEGDSWKIATINNLKTYHKSEQAINALGEESN